MSLRSTTTTSSGPFGSDGLDAPERPSLSMNRCRCPALRSTPAARPPVRPSKLGILAAAAGRACDRTRPPAGHAGGRAEALRVKALRVKALRLAALRVEALRVEALRRRGIGR